MLSDVFMLGNSKCATICKWPFSSATYQIQQGTNEKSKQVNTKRANRKRVRIKKENMEMASTGIWQLLERIASIAMYVNMTLIGM